MVVPQPVELRVVVCAVYTLGEGHPFSLELACTNTIMDAPPDPGEVSCWEAV